MVEFAVTLIVVKKEQTISAAKSLKNNCTHIDNWVWIFEGELSALEEDEVKFNVVDEGFVGFLGGLSKEELVDICTESFGVDIYEQKFEE
ncbi:MAG: hypothetical protein GY710_09420 [Desulfobacteraceae bacterium]|nr:hypothetical protein [Desulfobacteraceae bacterium]